MTLSCSYLHTLTSMAPLRRPCCTLWVRAERRTTGELLLQRRAIVFEPDSSRELIFLGKFFCCVLSLTAKVRTGWTQARVHMVLLLDNNDLARLKSTH
jgi:hypothetical protein